MSDSLLTEKKYSVPQAAKLLGIGTTNAYALIHAGVLTAYQVGSKFVLMESDLEAYLKQAKYEPPTPSPPYRRTHKMRTVPTFSPGDYKYLKLPPSES